MKRIALVATVTLCLAGLTATATAKPALKPPKVGTWKVIAAEGTSHGIKVLGGVVGSFRVTKSETITGFHLSFVEGGETALCAGAKEEAEGRRGTIRFTKGASAPILHFVGAWMVAENGGSLGLQPAGASLVTPPYGNVDNYASIEITLTSAKKGPRTGYVGWRGGECAVAFAVKPG